MDRTQVNIGDIFIIDHKGVKKVYSGYGMCKCPKQEFTVVSMSKSGLSVYYDDRRTNRKCPCSRCKDKKIRKSVGISQIIVIDNQLSRTRQKKLNKILR